MEPLEIERKFLIRRPEQALLEQLSERCLALRQIYLCRGADGANRRIRESRCGGETRYYYTEKLRLSAVTRIEREHEIGREAFEELLSQADPQRRPIEKLRWCVPFAGHTLEIDVFPFWARQAFCEAELQTEDEELHLPDWMEVLREVSDDRRYTNSALAREIPAEEI